MQTDILIVLLLWMLSPFYIVTLIISPIVPFLLIRYRSRRKKLPNRPLLKEHMVDSTCRSVIPAGRKCRVCRRAPGSRGPGRPWAVAAPVPKNARRATNAIRATTIPRASGWTRARCRGRRRRRDLSGFRPGRTGGARTRYRCRL